MIIFFKALLFTTVGLMCLINLAVVIDMFSDIRKKK
jgi:hypothetical protein